MRPQSPSCWCGAHTPMSEFAASDMITGAWIWHSMSLCVCRKYVLGTAIISRRFDSLHAAPCHPPKVVCVKDVQLASVQRSVRLPAVWLALLFQLVQLCRIVFWGCKLVARSLNCLIAHRSLYLADLRGFVNAQSHHGECEANTYYRCQRAYKEDTLT